MADMARKRPAEETAENIGQNYRYPSEFIEDIEESPDGLDSLAAEELRQNRASAARRDARFRRKHVDFEQAEMLMDKKSTDTDEEGIPARNKIRRIVEDLLSVVVPNVPDATLRDDKATDPTVSEEERRLQEQYLRETTKIANRAVKAVKHRSNFDNVQNKIIYDTVVDGVGYAHAGLRKTPSRRRQPRLDALLMKPTEKWGPSDLKQFQRLMNQPYVDHVEANEIYWREGVRSVEDDDMTRVTRARARNLQWMRDHFNDPEIQEGQRPANLWLDSVETDRDSDDARAGYVETWEIEEFIAGRSKKFLMAGGMSATEATWEVEYEEAILVYTAITTNKLLEYQVFTPREVPMELPFIPFYVKTSKAHPYGFSVPLMLELQQKFANRMLAVMAKQAMNTISPSAFAVMLSALGGEDREQIERALEEGGAAWLDAPDGQSITDVIQPFPSRPQVNTALAQVMQSEERAMEREGQASSPRLLASARSASGKQQIQSATDRPKQYSILNIAESIEDLHERLYQLLQRKVGREEMIMSLPGGGSVKFNDRRKEAVLETTHSGRPLTMDSQKSRKNPMGLVYRGKTFTKGDLTVPMHAKADTRGIWPTGLQAKLRLAAGMAEAGVLKSQKTVRELVLDERTRLRDDMNVAEEQASQDQLGQRIQQALQQAQQGGAQQSQNGQSVSGSQNPSIAGVEQDGIEQTRPGGGAGPVREQVGQERRSPEEDQAAREAEI